MKLLKHFLYLSLAVLNDSIFSQVKFSYLEEWLNYDIDILLDNTFEMIWFLYHRRDQRNYSWKDLSSTNLWNEAIWAHFRSLILLLN